MTRHERKFPLADQSNAQEVKKAALMEEQKSHQKTYPYPFTLQTGSFFFDAQGIDRMDPLSLILAALGAGSATGEQALISDAIKDSYSGLKALIQKKFAGKTKAEVALKEHESDPET